MNSLFYLLALLCSGAAYVIVAGIILAMIRQAMRPRWMSHPVPRALIAAAEGLCAPFRRILVRVGLPVRPLDLSPMLAVFTLQAVSGFLARLP